MNLKRTAVEALIFCLQNLHLPSSLQGLISLLESHIKPNLLFPFTQTMNLANFQSLFINASYLGGFIILFNNFHSSTSMVPGNETDHSALLSLEAALTSDSLQSIASWNESTHFCNWIGVTCGKKHQLVTEINLTSKKLTGPLSPSVGNLSFLRFFRIDNNGFTGKIPPEIARLSTICFPVKFLLIFLGA